MAARARRSWLPRRRWTRLVAAAVALPVFVVAGMAGYYYGRLSLVVEARLAGERVRVIPRVYGRPLSLRVGLTLSETDVVQRLNDLGYAQRERTSGPGEFALGPRAITVVPRTGDFAGQTLRAEWTAGRGGRSGGAAPGPAATHRAALCRRAAGRAGRARSAAAQRAGDHVARAAAAGAALGDSRPRAAGGARHRRPPLLPPSRHRPDPHRRRAADQPARHPRLPGRRQHDHPAAGPQLLPDRGDGARGAVGPAVDPPQAARAVHGGGARNPGHQGRDPRALSQRGLPRPSRVVRAARGGGSGAASSTPRTSATSRSAKAR